ncbi:MAG: ATP-binding protein, partial [Actinomycetota bacterium]|nr:ATP-binding protein [Actinomycetota bacterium]
VKANGEVRAVRLAALLLFGREDVLRRLVPTHEVAFQVLRGVDVEVNDFFRWPLLRVTEEIEARIRARNRESEIMVGMLRIGVPDYSERALREALANALIHRDYQRIGAVHFQWHEDRIEVSNPGGLPEGVRLDNLLVAAPRPRNPLLADALKRAGVVERTGRGIDTIFIEQLRNGRPAPSYAQSTPSDVFVAIPGGDANLDFVRVVVEESQAGRPLSLDEPLQQEQMVLQYVDSHGRITRREAAELCRVASHQARDLLARLRLRGLLEQQGAGRGVYYISGKKTEGSN